MTKLCRVFNVKLNTYNYQQQQENAMRPETMKLMTTIKAIAPETNNSYGRRRMNQALRQ